MPDVQPNSQPPKHHPSNDGITHINCYSKGKTALGRALSNFARIGFTHPIHGSFASLEGYWYFVKTGFRHEQLRPLSGYTAKSVGRKLEIVWMDPQDFQNEIRTAITLKVEQHPDLLDALLQNKLPLCHYYVYGQGDNVACVEQHAHSWQLEHLQSIVEKWSRADK